MLPPRETCVAIIKWSFHNVRSMHFLEINAYSIEKISTATVIALVITVRSIEAISFSLKHFESFLKPKCLIRELLQITTY